jgi:hypothetical protein
VSSVTPDDLRLCNCSLIVSVFNVRGCERCPSLIKLDTDRATPKMYRLDKGCAYPTEWVGDKIVRFAVGLDSVARERRQHLPGMPV